MISSVQKGSRKKRLMNLTAEAVLLWDKNYTSVNHTPFLNLGTPNESSWSLKTVLCIVHLKLWQIGNEGIYIYKKICMLETEKN